MVHYLHNLLNDCCCSAAKSGPTLCDPMDRSTAGFLSFTDRPKFAQIHVHGARDAIESSHPLPPTSPFALTLSQHRWPKYWSFSISPNECSGLISFKIDWFDLIAVQGMLKSLLQHHNLKAPILQCSAFFMVQLSHPYMITGKTIALSIWTFVSKVTSLLFNNTLSRFVIVSLQGARVS